MEAMRVQQVIAEDGEVVITDLPYKKAKPSKSFYYFNLRELLYVLV